MKRLPLAIVLLAALHLFALSCAKKDALPPAHLDPLARSQALIDSGNASFKRADYETAAKRYASATLVKPDDPAAFYGLGMALSKLGRDEDARTAYAKARALAGSAGDSVFSTPH
ncbi:MAG: tetratricopeptide repeat protein [Candidatus Eisenbacteria bacterium]